MIIPFSKWLINLITMVSRSPKQGYSPSKWAKWLINGGDPNHLLTGMILQVAPGARNRVVLSQREAVASEAEAVAMPLVEVFRETSPGQPSRTRRDEKLQGFFWWLRGMMKTISDDELLLKFAEIVLIDFVIPCQIAIWLPCSNRVIFSKSQRVSKDSQYTRMTFCDLQDQQQDRCALYLHTYICVVFGANAGKYIIH